MNYYLVDKTGDGTRNTPFRPNITDPTISYVCLEVGNQFLVGTNDFLVNTQITNLETFCNDNSINYQDVLKWFVGD
jgi:hypothetical protein